MHCCTEMMAKRQVCISPPSVLDIACPKAACFRQSFAAHLSSLWHLWTSCNPQQCHFLWNTCTISQCSHHCIASPCCTSCVGSMCYCAPSRQRQFLVGSIQLLLAEDAWLTDGLRFAKRNEVMTDPSERTVNGRRYIYGSLYKATDYLGGTTL